MSETLEYAIPRETTAPWGPVWVRPGRVSVGLMVLMVGAVAWLSVRHEPWVGGVTITTRPAGFALQDRYVLTFDRSMDEVTVWDVDTGRVVRQFGQGREEGRYFVGYYLVDGGRYLLRRSMADETCELVDPWTGAAVARGAAPPGRILVVSARGGRTTVLYGEDVGEPGGPRGLVACGVWRPFEAGVSNPVHRWVVPTFGRAELSPDGATVVVFHDALGPLSVDAPGYPGVVGDGSARCTATVYDTTSGEVVMSLDRRNPQVTPTFSADGEVLVTMTGDHVPGFLVPSAARARQLQQNPAAIERHAVRTGHRLSSVAVPGNFRGVAPFADAGAAVALGTVPGAPFGFGARADSVVDFTAGGVVRPFGTPVEAPVAAAFADGRRVAVAAGIDRVRGRASAPVLRVFDRRPWQPVAVLPAPWPWVASLRDLRVSPDGTRMAVSSANGVIRVYRKVGWECRESHLGVLGMPHAWLLSGLLIALAWSLRRDALAARARDGDGRVAVLSLVMLVVALPRAVQFVLTACTGEWLWTPAPLVVLAAVGLATGGRFWRFATMAVLAGALSANLWVLFVLRRGGLGGTWAMDVVDRTYGVPRMPVFVGVAVLAAGAVAGVCLLARRGRAVAG